MHVLLVMRQVLLSVRESGEDRRSGNVKTVRPGVLRDCIDKFDNIAFHVGNGYVNFFGLSANTRVIILPPFQKCLTPFIF